MSCSSPLTLTATFMERGTFTTNSLLLPLASVVPSPTVIGTVVVRRLHEFGVEVHRINFEAASTSEVQPWGPSASNRGDEPNPSVVWWRQFETDKSPSTLQDVDDLLVERAQWRA